LVARERTDINRSTLDCGRFTDDVSANVVTFDNWAAPLAQIVEETTTEAKNLASDEI